MNALVVAGGQWQVPLISYLQKNGYYVIVVDPYKDSKGVVLSNEHIQVDVREKELILTAINRLNKPIDLVCTDQSDISVETVAYIAKHLNICGNDEEIVCKFSNKYLSRQFAKSINVPVPEFTSVTSTEEIKNFIQKVGTPLIIKPCDAQSSKGIHKIENYDESTIKCYLEDALQYSFIKTAILEQFVEGYEITVEGFCAYGKHKVLAISKKKHFKTGIASTLTYPADIPEYLEKAIVEADNKYVEKSGLNFGPTHAEYIVNESTGQFYLVEIACRGGGTLISSDIVKWVSGFDVYDAYLKCLNGRPVDLYNFTPNKNFAELHFFDFGDGKILSISGIEQTRNMKGVLLLDFEYKPGDILRSCQDDRSRQGFFIALAETKDELNQLIDTVTNTIHIELEH